MSDDKSRKPDKAQTTGEFAQKVRLDGALRLPGMPVEFWVTDSKEAKASGWGVAKEILLTPRGVLVHSGDKRVSESVILIPWNKVEYVIPA